MPLTPPQPDPPRLRQIPAICRNDMAALGGCRPWSTRFGRHGAGCRCFTADSAQPGSPSAVGAGHRNDMWCRYGLNPLAGRAGRGSGRAARALQLLSLPRVMCSTSGG
ncbi:hypothetical protein G6F31_020003 [Rhizopus arrhizus]|nr:hypothetical protein G6F31_020003 [Rhizopus arrhizus]